MKFFNKYQENLFSTLIEIIKGYYKDNLTSIVIHGSYARSEARLNSDLDTLIVVQKRKRLSQEMDHFYENIEILLEVKLQTLYERYGINMMLSPLILTEEEAEYFNPLYLDMTDASFIAYDRDDFFRKILKRVKKLRETYNFKKETIANTFLWDLRGKDMVGQRI